MWHSPRGTGVFPGQAGFIYPLYHLYQEMETRYTRRGDERDWRAGAEAVETACVPYVDAQKKWYSWYIDGKRLMARGNVVPRWRPHVVHPLRERASRHRCLPRSDVVLRRVPRLVVQLAVRWAPLATKSRRASALSSVRLSGGAAESQWDRKPHGHPRRPETQEKFLTRPESASQNSIRVVHP